MKPGWTEVALGEVVEPKIDSCSILPEVQYKEVTVSLWGRGVRLRKRILGSEISASTRNRTSSGDFIISKIDARHGAYGFIPPELDGAVVSNDFPLYQVGSERICPRWLYWISQSSFFVDLCRRASKGTTNRVRLKESLFLNLKIPLPSLAEQQRIVAHLDAIEERLNRIQKLRDESEVARDALVISMHHAAAGGRTVRISKLLELDEEREPIISTGSYPQVGIRSFGNGIFTKGAILGSETTYKSYNRLSAGKFVMSQVKGWEGAVAVCPTELEGWFVSPEYRTFSCVSGQCDPDYLSHVVVTEWFQRQLLSATRGVGARRERVRPEMLLHIEIPFPDISKQLDAARTFSQLKSVQTHSNITLPRQDALIPSLLDRIFSRELSGN